MDSVLPAFVGILLMLSAILVPIQRFLLSQDQLHAARVAAEARLVERARTDLRPLSASLSADGRRIDVALLNTGQTRLAGIEGWDLIVHYDDITGRYHVDWLAPVDGVLPADGQWAVRGLFISAESAAPERFDRGLFGPAEKMVIQLALAPAVARGTSGLVAVSTANGLGLTTTFVRPCLPPAQPGDPPDCSAP